MGDITDAGLMFFLIAYAVTVQNVRLSGNVYGKTPLFKKLLCRRVTEFKSQIIICQTNI